MPRQPPTFFTSVHGMSCPKPQLKSTCLTAKFWTFLDHTQKGEKTQNVISSSVQHLISLIFAIHVSFTFTNDVNFVDKAHAEICDLSLFTLQFCYIDKFTYKSTVPLAKFNLGLLFTSALRACMNSRPSLNFTSGIIIFHHSPHEQSIYVYYSSKMSTSTYCTIW